jgi:hypothetical protein
MLALALAVVQTAYVLFESRPSALAVELLTLAFAFFIVLWAVADARQRRQVPCFDFGFFLFLGFPVSIVWYVLWTRRLRGWVCWASSWHCTWYRGSVPSRSG